MNLNKQGVSDLTYDYLDMNKYFNKVIKSKFILVKGH